MEKDKSSAKSRGFHVPGCNPSLWNNQLHTSTGVVSFDAILGGGIPVGTLLLLEADEHAIVYTDVLMKYFLAEGVVHEHHIFLADLNRDPSNTLKELPCKLISHPSVSKKSVSQKEESLDIAWRYEEKKKIQSAPSAKSPSSVTSLIEGFDLSKYINENQFNSMSKCIISLSTIIEYEVSALSFKKSSLFSLPPSFMHVLMKIKNYVADNNFLASATAVHKNILRITLPQIGSSLWAMDSDTIAALPQFLYCLRALLRSSFSVAMISVPPMILKNKSFKMAIENLSDIVVELQSREDIAKGKFGVLSDYHGFFHVKKLPQLNSISFPAYPSGELVFKLKRKVFVIELFHLPPDLSDNMSRNQEDPVYKKVKDSLQSFNLCSTDVSQAKSKLDF